MEASELRIGNYVMYEQTTHFVTEIRKDRLCSKWINQPIEEVDYECSFEYLKPIPLTTEWLIKLGFENKKIPIFISNNNYIIQGMIVFMDDDMFVCDKTKVIIKYVHELQNLYFALTKKELLIKKDDN